MGQDMQKCCKDNVVVPQVTEPPTGSDERPVTTSAVPGPPATAPQAAQTPQKGTSNTSATGDRMTSPEEHEIDKIRLRQLTTEFVQDVIKDGIKCEVLATDSTSREPASYSLDRSLRTFYVKLGSAANATPYKIVHIRDIWIGTEFVQFQKSIWAEKLSSADKERVVAVQFVDGASANAPDAEQVLLLLERDRSTAVRFVQAMTILRLYNSGTASDVNRA